MAPDIPHRLGDVWPTSPPIVAMLQWAFPDSWGVVEGMPRPVIDGCWIECRQILGAAPQALVGRQRNGDRQIGDQLAIAARGCRAL